MYDLKYINISLELFGSILSLILIVCLIVGDGRKTRLGKLFIMMLACNMVILLCDALAWGLKGDMSLHARIIVPAANFCVFSFGYIMLAVYTDYLYTYIAKRTTVPGRVVKILQWLCVAAILLVVLSQFNGMYYIIDENNMYQRQSGFWLSQVYGIVCLLTNTIAIIKYRKALHKKEAVFLLSHALFPIAALLIQIWVYGLAFLNIGMTLSLVTIYVGLQAEQSRELAESRISIMLSQIQPHFLYNSLLAIQDLCTRDPKEAENTVRDFSKYLRVNLDSLFSTARIPFEKEMEHVRIYLSLEQKRFEDDLRTAYDIQATNFLLPSLTLQPIVENAVRHGIMRREEGGTIWIRSWEDARFWFISVRDDGVGFDPAQKPDDGKTHTGMKNVRNRLSSLCSGALDIQSAAGKGTIATISIPKGAGKR